MSDASAVIELLTVVAFLTGAGLIIWAVCSMALAHKTGKEVFRLWRGVVLYLGALCQTVVGILGHNWYYVAVTILILAVFREVFQRGSQAEKKRREDAATAAICSRRKQDLRLPWLSDEAREAEIAQLEDCLTLPEAPEARYGKSS